jgi:hypothetical protein
MKALAFLPVIAFSVVAQTPDAGGIMRRAAENVSRAQAARASYVFDQNIFVRIKRANGKLAQEEARKYTVAPTEKGAGRKLVEVKGKILDGKKEIDYSEAGFRRKEMDIDAALVNTFAREIMWRRNTMGPMTYWFPLEHPEKYAFQFEGEERYRDYDVYKISFREIDGDDDWQGEALIERNEFQPVLVTSAWTGKVPAPITIGLGTNVKQIGAKITYQRFDKDVWFPVSIGGEMKLRVLFLYARTIAFSAANADFRKADVQSSVEFEDIAQNQEPPIK